MTDTPRTVRNYPEDMVDAIRDIVNDIAPKNVNTAPACAAILSALSPWLVNRVVGFEPKKSTVFHIETMKSTSSHFKHFSDCESHIHAIEIAEAIFEMESIKAVQVLTDEELVYLKRKVEE